MQTKTGAANEIRTRDLVLGKHTLYQLSYSRIKFLVEDIGLEPITYSLQSYRSPRWANPPLILNSGADDGNRTHFLSLEGCDNTIIRHPHCLVGKERLELSILSAAASKTAVYSIPPLALLYLVPPEWIEHSLSYEAWLQVRCHPIRRKGALKLVAGEGNAPSSILAYETEVRLSEPAIDLTNNYYIISYLSCQLIFGLPCGFSPLGNNESFTVRLFLKRSINSRHIATTNAAVFVCD